MNVCLCLNADCWLCTRICIYYYIFYHLLDCFKQMRNEICIPCASTCAQSNIFHTQTHEKKNNRNSIFAQEEHRASVYVHAFAFLIMHTHALDVYSCGSNAVWPNHILRAPFLLACWTHFYRVDSIWFQLAAIIWRNEAHDAIRCKSMQLKTEY